MVGELSRRGFLASLSAVVAGCSGDPGTPDSDRQAGTPDDTPPGQTNASPPSNGTGPTATHSSTTSSTASRTVSPPSGIERLAADDPALEWAVRIPGPVARSPAVDMSRGHVYVGTGTEGTGTPIPGREDDDGGVYALRLSDGTLSWQATTTAPVTRQPVVLDGRVHVLTGYTNGYTGEAQRIVAYEQDGTRRWATQRRSGLLSIVAANDGILFAGTSDDVIGAEGQSLFAVGPDGNVRWERGAGDAMGAVVADGRLLYNAGSRAMIAYDPASGSRAWQVNGDPVESASSRVAAFDGLCFTRSPDETEDGHALVAHSTADGSEQWRYDTPPRHNTDFVTAGVSNIPQPIDGATDEHQLVGADLGGTVFALRTDDGHERWTFTADATARDAPTVGDAIYVSDVEGTVYALSPDDGSERWRASLPRLPRLQAVSNGVIAMSDGEHGRTVASFDGDGDERWRFSTSKELLQPTVVGDRAYACASDGTVFAFVASDDG